MANIKSITGEIEAIGQHHIANDGVSYAYLRLVDKNGNVKMLKSVMAPNTVNSYISLGREGTFHLFRVRRNNVIFAFNNDHRFAYDPSDIRHVRLVASFYLFIGLFFTIAGIISLYLLNKVSYLPFEEHSQFSIFHIAVIIFTLVCAFHTWTYLSFFLLASNRKLKNYLQKFGFSF